MLILNAGSNIGFHTMLASREGFETVSLDPSRSALTSGRRMNWIDQCECGDIMHLPFKENAFSNAIFSEVIIETPGQLEAVRESARCCHRIMITTSPIKSDDFYFASESVKSILKRHPNEIAEVREIHPCELTNMISHANLVLISIRHRNPVHIWNIAGIVPPARNLDLSALDALFGFKMVSARLVCGEVSYSIVCERFDFWI